jgi:hypothetical protein
VATSLIVTELGHASSIRIDVKDVAVPRDAVYAAACALTDRCYVRLVLGEDGEVTVSLRPKAAIGGDAAALRSAFEAELAKEVFRCRVEEDGRELTTAITQSAFGAPTGTLPPADDLGTFDDPLGIALSWEQKQAAQAAQGGAAGEPGPVVHDGWRPPVPPGPAGDSTR